MRNGEYHYTESGLDSVYLLKGFEIKGKGSRKTVAIQDIEGLHRAIGNVLVRDKKHLTGSEIRFLRTEMLLSQSTLAALLRVGEQTVARWEKGRTRIPGTADATLRLLFLEHNGESEKITSLLQKLADLEDRIHRSATFEPTESGWDLAA